MLGYKPINQVARDADAAGDQGERVGGKPVGFSDFYFIRRNFTPGITGRKANH